MCKQKLMEFCGLFVGGQYAGGVGVWLAQNRKKEKENSCDECWTLFKRIK